MLPLLIIVVILLILVVSAFLIGWNAAITKHRAHRRRLETAVGDLEQQVSIVNEQLTSDPQRASIDIGKRYATNQMQTTIDRLREEIPR